MSIAQNYIIFRNNMTSYRVIWYELLRCLWGLKGNNIYPNYIYKDWFSKCVNFYSDYNMIIKYFFFFSIILHQFMWLQNGERQIWLLFCWTKEPTWNQKLEMGWPLFIVRPDQAMKMLSIWWFKGVHPSQQKLRMDLLLCTWQARVIT